MLSREEVIGLRFRTANIAFRDQKAFSYKTLTVCAVENSGKEGAMILSALPCPPNCAGGGDTFTPPKEATM